MEKLDTQENYETQLKVYLEISFLIMENGLKETIPNNKIRKHVLTILNQRIRECLINMSV